MKKELKGSISELSHSVMYDNDRLSENDQLSLDFKDFDVNILLTSKKYDKIKSSFYLYSMSINASLGYFFFGY
jgi:hypothetical protein